MRNLKLLLKTALLLLMASGTAKAQTHFKALGDFSSAMNINLLEAKVNSVNLESGDEIGVFDGNICVGAVVLTGSLEEKFDLITISCPTGADDKSTSKKDGFIAGDPILFKIWDASQHTEINVVTPAFINNKTGQVISPPPAFMNEASAFVSVTAICTPFQLTISTKNAECFKGFGELNLNVSEGGTPFAGGLYNIWLNEKLEGKLSSFLKEVPAGSYNLVIEDANGSKNFQAAEVIQPDQISFNIDQTVANCSFDSGRVWIDVNSITGGTAPYDYWMISDNPDFEGWTKIYQDINEKSDFLSPGEYYVRLFDSNGCYGDYINNEGNGRVYIGSLSLEYVSGEPHCYSESVDVKIRLNYDNTNHQISYSADKGNTWQTSNNFKDLVAGKSYWLGYKDETIGCTYFVEKKISAPDPIIVYGTTSENAVCFNGFGKINIGEITGGNGPVWNIKVEGLPKDSSFTEKWYKVNTSSNIVIDDIPASEEPYKITVYDSLGCQSPDFMLSIAEPSAFFYEFAVNNATGDSCATGRINIKNITGGTPFEQGKYNVWFDGVLQGKLSEFDSGNNLYPGKYEIMITDMAGCVVSDTLYKIGIDVTPVKMVHPNDTVIDDCFHTQQQIDNLLAEWITMTSTTVSGGCNPKVKETVYGSAGYCGGSVFVKWIASDENNSSDTCTASFTVLAPDSLSVEIPKDTTVKSCYYLNVDELQTTFNSWVDSVSKNMRNSLKGGCAPLLSNNAASIQISDLCSNHDIPVIWTVADMCDTVNYSAVFHIIAPDKITITVPQDTIISVCDFSEMPYLKMGFGYIVMSVQNKIENSIRGGCNSFLTNNLDEIVIPGLCNDLDVDVTWTLHDLCDSTNFKTTFHLMAPDSISIEVPRDTTILSCNFSDRNELQLAFENWFSSNQLRIENSIVGGCMPEITYNVGEMEIPDICVNWEKQVTWTIYDLCDTLTYSAVFRLSAPGGDCPQHFHTVWEGTSGQNHMNINIIGAKLDGLDLEVGDEIGVFDGAICVGYGKVAQPINDENILQLIVSGDDGSGNGFKQGDEITYKIWDCSQSTEYYVSGVSCFNNQLVQSDCSPFETGATAFVALEAIIVPRHFVPCWTGNGVDHMNIIVISATLDQHSLEFGDEVAVFDGDNCVGFGKVSATIDNNHILQIVVSHQDYYCGYVEGNNIIFKYWDASENMELEPVQPTYYDNQLNLLPVQKFKIGATAFVRLSGVTEVCLTLDIEAGWSLFSIPVVSKITDIQILSQSLIDNNSLVKIQDDKGNSLENWGIFGGWTNNIPDVQLSEGYKIKLSTPDTLRICGAVTGYPFPVPLLPGWSIMGFPKLTRTDGMEVVQQLIDRGTLIKVQDEKGNSIENWGIFGGWTNGIGDFIPGDGYKIKLLTADTLWIYENYPKSATILTEAVPTTHFKTVYKGNGVDHMNINLVGLPINMINAGDELAIFDGTNCVGAVTIMPHNLQSQTVSFAASAKDEYGMAGFAEGNLIILKLWNSQNNQEFSLDTEIVKGTSTFVKHETTLASLEKYATTGLDGLTGAGVTEINCYPNPFCEKITIEINLSEDSKVEVEVLNQLGQKVKTITTKQNLPEGLHKLEWDGTNAGNQKITSGIYHLNVRIGEIMIHRKIVYSN